MEKKKMKKPVKKVSVKKKLKFFHIETNDGAFISHFFTEAKNNKQALKNLLTKSNDFKNLVKDDCNLIINVESNSNNGNKK